MEQRLPVAVRTRTSFADPSAGRPRGRGELMLVVDDELSIRDITRQTLEAFDYRVITASDGAEAAAVYAKQAKLHAADPKVRLVRSKP